jgi:hypothetical protein
MDAEGNEVADFGARRLRGYWARRLRGSWARRLRSAWRRPRTASPRTGAGIDISAGTHDG